MKMEKKKFHLASAGNVLVPAYLSVEQKGYTINKLDDNLLSARNENAEFIAEDPLYLLGLISIYEIRGKNWKATDKEIDEYSKKFD